MATPLYTQTPTISVIDNRGIAVRTLTYCSQLAGDGANSRVTHTLISNNSLTAQHRDPRLFDAWQVDTSKPANLSTFASLNGKPLRRNSSDSGSNVLLYDSENRPVWAIDGRDTATQWSYDVLGRPLKCSILASDESTTRNAESWIYGDTDEQTLSPQDNNLRGVCVRKYDDGGRQAIDSIALSGAVLTQSQTFLLSAEVLPDWQGAESDWIAQLESGSDADYITITSANALGQPIAQTDAAGHTLTWGVDVYGAPDQQGLILSDKTALMLLNGLSYSAAGQPLTENAGNGVVTSYGYAPQTQRITSITVGRSSDQSTLQALSYTYDPVGNITTVTDSTVNRSYFRNQTTNGTRTFGYDTLYQLQSATGRESATHGTQSAALPSVLPLSSGDSAYSNYTRNYNYDRSGNLSSLSHTGISSYKQIMVTDTQSNRSVIQNSAEVTPDTVTDYFDVSGNLQNLQMVSTSAADTANMLIWNTDNQLQTVVLVDRDSVINNSDREVYQYRDGNRIRKQTRSLTNSGSALWTVNEVRYLPGLELRKTYQETVSASGTSPGTTSEALEVVTTQAGRSHVRVLHWTVGIPDGLTNNQPRYGVDDNIGSLTLELDGSGQLISREEYYPYGGTAVWLADNQVEANYKTLRYSGKERDQTGLCYYGYRYYAPWLCRWLNADPGREVDGLNLFRMVHNNPVNYSDRRGLNDWNSNKEMRDLFTDFAKHIVRALYNANSVNPTSKLAKYHSELNNIGALFFQDLQKGNDETIELVKTYHKQQGHGDIGSKTTPEATRLFLIRSMGILEAMHKQDPDTAKHFFGTSAEDKGRGKMLIKDVTEARKKLELLSLNDDMFFSIVNKTKYSVTGKNIFLGVLSVEGNIKQPAIFSISGEQGATPKPLKYEGMSVMMVTDAHKPSHKTPVYPFTINGSQSTRVSDTEIKTIYKLLSALPGLGAGSREDKKQVVLNATSYLPVCASCSVALATTSIQHPIDFNILSVPNKANTVRGRR
ncbi:RHS repeat-associated core domain-containing protein [Edaphovirga cremea]|uniref:RHS repeat-associated core domain-containing protein n=1 Tax=Edaphovirga cremea TaxID=2267246 RepID=UPI000DEF2753|nr:RHS repeat-associated core domain-containing protein [Edaphovirga cremea]